MKIRCRLDFNNIYSYERISNDIRSASFKAPLENGDSIILNIRISKTPENLIPNTYNLFFGPFKNKNKIDDKIELAFLDHSKVFSTILFFALTYLMCNRGHLIGVDGSDYWRIRYYWTMLHMNFDFLSKHFQLFGVKYYVRISRMGKYQYEDPFDFQDVFGELDRIDKNSELSKLRYNYLIFSLKNEKHNLWKRKEKMN